MGQCLCSDILDDDGQLTQSQSFARELAVLRSKIQARKLPVVWMLGDGTAVNPHAANVAEKLGFACLNAEKIIKEEVGKENSSGKMIRAKIAQTKSVPDRIVVDLMKERMVTAGDTRGYILAGFPTSPKQAILFTREMTRVDCVILLQYHPPPPSKQMRMPGFYLVRSPSIPPTPSPPSPSSPHLSPEVPLPIINVIGGVLPESESKGVGPSPSLQPPPSPPSHSPSTPSSPHLTPQVPPPIINVIGGVMPEGDSKGVGDKRQNNRERDREHEREMERAFDRQKERQREREKEKEREREKEEEMVIEILESTGGNADLLLETINASQPDAHIFLKIEAAILDRTQTTKT